MGMNDSLFEQLKQKMPDLAAKYRLDLVVLFGSQAKGTTHAQSDVDIAFHADFNMRPIEIADMQFDFSQTLGLKDIELIDLKDAPPLLLKQIAAHSILLYEKERFFFGNFKIYANKLYMEAQPLLKLRQKQFNHFLQTHAG